MTLTNVVFSGNGTPNEHGAVACHETLGDGDGTVQWRDVEENGSSDTPCAAGAFFADPGLLPLADHGGPTETMALPAASPAAVVSDHCPELDQRGEPRVGRCDSGAHELQE